MKLLPILLAIVFGVMMPTAQAATGTELASRKHDLSRHHRHYHRWTVHHHPNPVHIANPLPAPNPL